MNMEIISEMKRLISEFGEADALAEVFDSIDTALGPDSEWGKAVCDLRDRARVQAGEGR